MLKLLFEKDLKKKKEEKIKVKSTNFECYTNEVISVRRYGDCGLYKIS